jgi:isocitrate dehydrogenase
VANKIKVQGPVVELDGDEMTRIIWQFIKDQLILPYLDVDLRYYDLSIESRDATDDQITDRRGQRHQRARRRRQVRDHHARRGARRGVRPQEDVALAQRHDPQHPRRRDLPRADHHLEHPPARAGLDPADHRRPSRARRPVQGDRLRRPGPRHGHDHLPADDGGEPMQFDVAKFTGGGIAMGMYNYDDSIRDFARASFRYGLARNYPVYLSTKNTILKAYDGASRTSSRRSSTPSSPRVQEKGLTYEHRLIDDMVGRALKWEGGYVWACKNYDGDVQSDTVAQGLRLARPDDLGAHDSGRPYGRGRGGARHGDPALPPAPAGQADVDRTRWPRSSPGPGGLQHRGKLDGTPEVTDFAEKLEQVCIETVEGRSDDQGPRAADLEGPARSSTRRTSSPPSTRTCRRR